MIRDPSDGSVREAPKPAIGIPIAKTLSEEVSGLPAGSEKQRNIAWLERSREWLKTYFEQRGKA